VKIHPLSTGTVSVKRSFLHARTGARRQVSLFLPDEFSPPLPIHVWVVEHGGRRVLVDTGEVAGAHDVPFARFSVRSSEELAPALSRAGFAVGDIDTVVLTHMHGDHMDGAVHLGEQPVLVHEPELAYSRTLPARLAQRLLRQPIPPGVRFEPFALGGGAFGAFPASMDLIGDGRIVVVPTPGHTPGHVSVVCVDDDGRHVFLAGDATDTLEQLHARRADAVAPKPAVQIESIDRILAHAREQPTVYLPSHDPDSATRLAGSAVI
jgi:glyoxylase-like metal-dependent hydrolase (beta-lactamase superfamily II)